MYRRALVDVARRNLCNRYPIGFRLIRRDRPGNARRSAGKQQALGELARRSKVGQEQPATAGGGGSSGWSCQDARADYQKN